MKLSRAVKVALNWRINMHDSIKFKYPIGYDQDMDDAIKRLVKLAKSTLKKRSAK